MVGCFNLFKEDAERIVACVNFLQGIPTSDLLLVDREVEWMDCIRTEIKEDIAQMKREQRKVEG